MSEPSKPIPVTMSVDDVRATLIFLSVAKSTYEFVGRMTGDGDERFAHQRIAIETLSVAYRTMIANAVKEQAAREVAAKSTKIDLDERPAQDDIDPR